ncbi:bifunctional diguanylate cyclase/phosphohydrolase [Bacillus sp. Marseille-P3661]|uniref:bifunctional diguanylate cyclase/phosphohydrolase n=1 Tax=Bacillus sp. Marseille-P3661 TaxID=1936234 RepID=UPI000C81F6F4|nr:diguanylate cyclase [Bacillus sp. Marseille-P3661]
MEESNSHKNNLFKHEISIVEKGKELIAKGTYNDKQLLNEYKKLVQHYEKLLRVTKKAFSISDLQGETLKQREFEKKILLDNAGQGFLTFGKDLLVHKEYSAECRRIFQKKIIGAPIHDLLWEDNFEINLSCKALLKSLFSTENEQAHLSYLDQLPRFTMINDRKMELDFKIIHSTDRYEDFIVMLILTDVTERFNNQQKVDYLSFHDELTSLYNRSYIKKILPTLLNRNQLPLSVIVADMNGLKLMNDVFGHEKGDQFIQYSAQILLNCCSEQDMVARWGGDEFLVLLPKTNELQCLQVIKHIKRECLNSKKQPIEVSLALGAATLQDGNIPFSEIFKRAEKDMYKHKLLESKSLRKRIVCQLHSLMETKVTRDPGQKNRIQKMASKFAELVGLEPASTEMRILEKLVLLHDLGKIAIPTAILRKPTALTNEEWEMMQTHSEIGYRLALAIGEMDAADFIVAMHENWDGSGYPHGLKEIEIPFISRLLAIVVAFDVMMHDRVFQKAKGKDAVLAELIANSGTQFDPELTKTFVEKINVILEHK